MDNRISPDGMLLQAQLGTDDMMTIKQIALAVFGEPGQIEPTSTQMCRAKAAARSLVSMGAARAFPNRRDIESIKSTASPGTQTAAMMNLMIRKAHEVETVGTGDAVITAAGIIEPQHPAVEEALNEQKARVAKPFQQPYYAIM